MTTVNISEYHFWSLLASINGASYRPITLPTFEHVPHMPDMKPLLSFLVQLPRMPMRVGKSTLCTMPMRKKLTSKLTKMSEYASSLPLKKL